MEEYKHRLLKLALRMSIDVENLLAWIKKHNRSTTKIAKDANLVRQEIDFQKFSQSKKFAFEKKQNAFKEVDLLKIYLFSDNLTDFNNDQKINISRCAQCWQLHDQMKEFIGIPDPTRLFCVSRIPTPGGSYFEIDDKKAEEQGKERGYLINFKSQGLYLTDKGCKLPKVAKAIAILDQRDTNRGNRKKSMYNEMEVI